VAIVNETMARRHWPGGDAVGRRIRLAAHETTVEIVGVVGDVKPFRPNRHADPQIYWPYRQAPRWASMFAVRTAGDPAPLLAPIRARLAEIDPELGIGAFVTMDELAARQLVGPRFNMLLLGLFALLSLALATAGVYGVISRAVEQRSHEIGVRLALGARRAEILRMIIAGGMRWTLAGVALGLAAAPALTLALRRLLITVSPRDPVTFAAVALVLVAVALAACLVPALRATRVDPVAALRCE
jgi:putative ABC transport system permease protein